MLRFAGAYHDTCMESVINLVLQHLLPVHGLPRCTPQGNQHPQQPTSPDPSVALQPAPQLPCATFWGAATAQPMTHRSALRGQVPARADREEAAVSKRGARLGRAPLLAVERR
ncbi:hypothetical protein BKA80DRAFT_274717 [Phyllosticta citrichinensis]